MRVVVYGLWHLGCVTAACLASAGHSVIGLHSDPETTGRLRQGRAPLHEPDLDELLTAEQESGRLTFADEPTADFHGAEVLWVTFDTPVDDRDEADVDAVRQHLDSILPAVPPGTLVLISSQVPVGFTRALQRDWQERGLHFAYSPENLRLGKALECFRSPERVIVGTDGPVGRDRVSALLAPFAPRIEWMSIESAEMTKHALNAFLATSVTFINELARLCEVLGADAREVERGLKSEGRIGARAYLSPGGPFSGGTLARDLRFLAGFGRRHCVPTPVFDGVLASNSCQSDWLREKVAAALRGIRHPLVAVLGLTYKPGTSTLRRSMSVDLCRWLRGQGIAVQAHDPALGHLPPELESMLRLCTTAEDALQDADLAIVATDWPEFRHLKSDRVVARMKRPWVIEPNWFLAGALANDDRVRYLATGRPTNELRAA